MEKRFLQTRYVSKAMNLIRLFLLYSYVLLTGCSKPTFIDIVVTDPKGRPVPHTQIHASWSWNSDLSGKSSPNFRIENGITDSKGYFRFSGFTKGQLSFSASKEGYYRSFTKVKSNDPITIPIRRKKNPIPMYAKQAKIDLPSGEGVYGYDLLIGDLVSPYGEGEYPDLQFCASTTERKNKNRTFYQLHVDITFPDKNDGIQAIFVPSRIEPHSDYNLPFTAPINGYQPSLKSANGNTMIRHRDHIGKDNFPSSIWHWTELYEYTDYFSEWSEDVNYFIRVRSDGAGNALYGLIRGFIRADYRGTTIPNLEFTYYLNPDGSQNIEYDPTKNLTKQFGRYKLHEYSPPIP